MERITPCPDCKSALLSWIKYERRPLNNKYVPSVYCWSLFCNNCHLQGPVRKDKHKAIKAWNQLSKKPEKEG